MPKRYWLMKSEPETYSIDDLERAYNQVASIVDAETVRHRRLPLLADQVRRLAEELDRQIIEHSRPN